MYIQKISSLTGENKIQTSLEKSKERNDIRLNNRITPEKMFQIYMGRDLVSFGAKDFNCTLRENYFKLKEGCMPDKFQIDAAKALYNGKDVLSEAPTGTGKTAIAHYVVAKNMKEGKKTFYTTPLKALSNQKVNELKAEWGEENVGILTGDRRENIDAPIVLMTTEVYRNMALANLYGEQNQLTENLATVIFDEFHYLDDANRGSVWEEAVMLTPLNVQILELSATIGNSEELKDWQNTIRDNNVVLVSMPQEARAVPLQFDIIKTNSYKKEEKRIQNDLKKKGFVHPEEVKNYVTKPSLSDFKYAVNMLGKKEQLPAIFFIFSRNFSRELLDYLSDEGMDLTTPEEKQEIEKIINKYRKEKYIGSDLNEEALEKGYAIHNAGIIPAQKEMIEELFQKKLTKVVIATETLAAGINMPAKTVVISSPYKPNENKQENEYNVSTLTANEYKQMSGRAGRRGIDSVGYVYTMPVDKNTEMEFLYLEAMNSNPLRSRYNPDYSFLTYYYDYNDDDSKLVDLFKKTFYVYNDDIKVRNARLDELIKLIDTKTQVLKKQGFIDVKEGKVQLTQLGQMASKVNGYDTLALTKAISNSRVFDENNPEALAMTVAAIANPASPNENSIELNTDLTDIFSAAADSIDEIYRKLYTSISSKLNKIGMDIEKFNSYEEMLEYAQALEIRDMDEDDIKKELDDISAKRAKMYRITKTSGHYTAKDVVKMLKNKEIVPSKILEEYLEILEIYKNRLNYKDIDSYIEKQEIELALRSTEEKGKKAKARADKKCKSIQKDIDNAKFMKYLDEHLVEALSSNYKFLKENPPAKIIEDYIEIEQRYNKSSKKGELIEQIQGLIGMDNYIALHNVNRDNSMNYIETSEFMNTLNREAMEVYKTEQDLGVDSMRVNYGKNSAKIVYTWALLNKINPDSMSNWKQILKIIPGKAADEGTIYRTIMQTADLLSQIVDAAEAGIKNAEYFEEEKYYAGLKSSAQQARKLILKEPAMP